MSETPPDPALLELAKALARAAAAKDAKTKTKD
jgi:hypothetical protein